jgi:hypothetical protein
MRKKAAAFQNAADIRASRPGQADLLAEVPRMEPRGFEQLNKAEVDRAVFGKGKGDLLSLCERVLDLVI